MALKFAIEDLASDLAYIGQITTGVTKQVKGVKKKAENALAAGYTDTTAKLDGSFFLSRELYDLDPSYITYAQTYLDRTVTRLKDLHAFPFANASPSVLGPYYRNWPQSYPTNYTCETMSLTNIDISAAPATINGHTLAINNKVLLTGQSATSENGVYLVTEISPSRVFSRFTTADILYATLLVSSGTYASTAWWNYGTAYVHQYAQMQEYVVPNGLSGDALYSARSHKIYGVTYYTTVKTIDGLVTTLKTQMATFVTDVNTLRADTTIAAVISHSATVITDKTNIDATIASIDNEIYSLERIALHFNPWIPTAGSLWDATDRSNQIMGGFIYKPHKPINGPTAYNQLEKTYNNNFTKSLGDGSGGAASGGGSMTGNAGERVERQLQIANNQNSMIEYWSQIGWMAAERTSNYKLYLEMLERDLERKGLEEILEMHDKAVQYTYEKEQNLDPGFLTPYSPKPLLKPQRVRPDNSLPYTEEELDLLDPLR